MANCFGESILQFERDFRIFNGPGSLTGTQLVTSTIIIDYHAFTLLIQTVVLLQLESNAPTRNAILKVVTSGE